MMSFEPLLIEDAARPEMVSVPLVPVRFNAPVVKVRPLLAVNV